MIRVRTNPLRIERVADDIQKDLDSSKKRAMARTVLYGTTVIEDRTAQGRGIRGPFKKYSESWRRVREELGLESSKVTLEFGYERRASVAPAAGETQMTRSSDRWVKRPSMLGALQGQGGQQDNGRDIF